MAAEFKSHANLNGEIELACLYNSRSASKDRQVFRLQIGLDVFAMKVDHLADETGPLRGEFETLQGLHTYFSEHDKLSVPEPLYLSSSGKFCIISFLDGKTATVALREKPDSKPAGQVFRKAGLFLNELHEYKGLSVGKLYPNWMFKAIEKAVATGPYADASQYTQMYEKFRSQSKNFTQKHYTKGFSHGDFHASNFILGHGVAHGIDFSETSEKLVVYDIVDFLKSDIYRLGVLNDVDESGVTKHSKSMFLKLYQHPLDIAALNFCMRGRLLIDWVRITPERHAKSTFQQNKFEQLRTRLEIAFQN